MFLKLIKTIITRKKIFVYTPLALIWVLLFILTSLPGSELPAIKVSDKVLHFISYEVLGIFLYLTLVIQNQIKLMKTFPALSALMVAVVYGGFDEIHQSVIPGRSCDIYDWIADICGALCAVTLIKIVSALIGKKYKKETG